MNQQKSYPIVGIRHHDYANCLDELYATAMGRRVTLRIEEDNVAENNAVIAYLGTKFLGYVRTENRPEAYQDVMATARQCILTRVTDIDPEHRVITVTAESVPVGSTTPDETENMLANWQFEGRLLPTDPRINLLQAAVTSLQTLVDEHTPWDDDMTDYLTTIMQIAWVDISAEMRSQLEELLRTLTDNAHITEYAQAVAQIQYTIDYCGSPEVRRYQAKQILDSVNTKDMNFLLVWYDDAAEDMTKLLPPNLVNLFNTDGELFMGRMAYMRLPFAKIQAVNTLLAMSIALKNKKDADHQAKQDLLTRWVDVWDPQHTKSIEELVNILYVEKLVITNSSININTLQDNSQK